MIQLHDKEGNSVPPKTYTDCVFNSDEESLQDLLGYCVEYDDTTATLVGNGYISLSDGVVGESVDTSGSNYANRRTWKVDVEGADYALIKTKTDCGFPLYVLADDSLNALEYKVSTMVALSGYGDVQQFFLELPSNAKWLYVTSDYSDFTNCSIKLIHGDTSIISADSFFAGYEEYFTVKVHDEKPESALAESISWESKTLYDDYCYVGFPSSYSGKLKIAILNHGGGMYIENCAYDTNETMRLQIARFFRSLGYVVLMCNGLPQEYADEKGITIDAQCGGWMATESVQRAYEYICDKFPCIDPNSVFMWGTSQGGMVSENVAELTNIPIVAECIEEPVLSFKWNQFYLGTSRLNTLNALYDYSLVSGESFEEQIDDSKVMNLDPSLRGFDEGLPIEADNLIAGSSATGVYLLHLSNVTHPYLSGYDGTRYDPLPTEDFYDAVTCKKFRREIPLCILHGLDDGTASPIISQAYAQAIRNAGGTCVHKHYAMALGVGHGVATNTTNYTTQYTPIPTYVSAGMLEAADWFYKYGGYEIPDDYIET